MRRVAAGADSPGKVLWGTIFSSVGYFTLALACLRQWGTSAAWSRVDLFSGGFLGLLILATTYDFRFGLGRTLFRSQDALREASGLAYDARTIVIMALLSVADALVFLDYGHWHLVPALQHPALQSGGLVLDVIAVVWLMWADARLARHFAGDFSRRTVIQDGPFRYVRHPRYAGILAIRVAFALVFASALGWVLSLAWLLGILRRIRLEEAHLREVFGREYDTYAQRTPRLVPSFRTIRGATRGPAFGR